MSFETPVTDRTNLDVKDVENKISNSKGALSYTMLNRIENNSNYLASLLTSYNYPVNITVKTDWTRNDFLYPIELDRIKNNVTALKEAYYSLPTTPSLVTGKKTLNYTEANDIEEIERDLEFLITNMEQVFVYSGVANSGQNRMWQQRYRRVLQ